ncbi:MAG TPA: hypothetical protein VFL81_01675 [Candidatus Saccharimonadales bacterium]|nr:hypothetical protein [Candidatus Saccharimonadales bacterium]
MSLLVAAASAVARVQDLALSQVVHHQVGTVVPMAACVKQNKLLLGPLGPFLNKLEGGLGGLLVPLAAVMAVVMCLVAVVTIRSERSSDSLKAMVLAPAAVIILMALLAVYYGLVGAFNGAC